MTMAKYTITIKTLIDNDFDFGLTSYPIFDENYRETLNNNILNYYFESEIGFETAELFKRYLNNKMMLIMPKYNAIYQSQIELLNNGLLNNVNLTENFESSGTSSGTNNSSSNSNSNSDSKSLYQDTPQGKIFNKALNEQEFATNFTENENNIHDSSTSNSTANNETTNNYIKTLIDFEDTQIFKDAKNYTCILIVENEKNNKTTKYLEKITIFLASLESVFVVRI